MLGDAENVNYKSFSRNQQKLKPVLEQKASNYLKLYIKSLTKAGIC